MEITGEHLREACYEKAICYTLCVSRFSMIP